MCACVIDHSVLEINPLLHVTLLLLLFKIGAVCVTCGGVMMILKLEKKTDIYRVRYYVVKELKV